MIERFGGFGTMAGDELQHIDEKLKRAEHHIGEARDLIERLIRHLPTSEVVDPDPATRGEFSHSLARYPVDTRISVITGEVLYQLRSSLDHLICALIRHEDPGSDCSKAQFPILDETDNAKFKRLTKGIRRTAVRDAIDALQPYRAPNDRRVQHLAKLRDLSNTDKHRQLILHMVHPEKYLRLDVRMGSQILTEVLPERHARDLAEEIGEFGQGIMNVLGVENRIAALVVFKDWAQPDGPVPASHGLKGLHWEVASVVDGFRAFF